MAAGDRDIWMELRPINWACDSNVDFSLDALKGYLALLGIGSRMTFLVGDDVVVNATDRDILAETIFADEHPTRTPQERFALALVELARAGVAVDRGAAIEMRTVHGSPYRPSVSDGYVGAEKKKLTGSFVRLKAGMSNASKVTHATHSPIALLAPEELLLLLILFQGARWVFGGVHQEYVRINRGSVVLGTLVKDMWDSAMRYDEPHNCAQEHDALAVLDSLMTKGHFAWGRVLADYARDSAGKKVSSQRTVVLRSDTRHPDNSGVAEMIDVLIPCYGYKLGRYQSDFTKLIARGELTFEDLTPSNAAIFGVTRWATT